MEGWGSMKTTPSTVLAFDNVKHAALFCDYVIPIITIIGDSLDGIQHFLSDILPPGELFSNPDLGYRSILKKMAGRYFDFIDEIKETDPGFYAKWQEEMGYRKPIGPLTLIARNKFFRHPETVAFYTSLLQIIQNSIEPQISGIIGDLPDQISSKTSKDVACRLSDIEIIDVSNLSWQQIMEFRKDKDSVKNLRKLRLFFQENFEGKSKSYVEDKILNMLDEYNDTIERWKFEKKLSSFECIFTDKAIQAVSVAGIASALLGTPLTLPALGAAATELIFNFGQMKLKLSRIDRNIIEFKKSNPVTYLFDINSKAKSEN